MAHPARRIEDETGERIAQPDSQPWVSTPEDVASPALDLQRRLGAAFAGGDIPEPYVERWSGRRSLAMALGGAAAAWGGLLGLAWLALR